MTNIIVNLGTFLLLVNTICFIGHYHKNSSTYKVFALYLVLMLSTQLTTSYLNYLKENNLFLSHFYFIGQFITLTFFFNKIFKNKTIHTLTYVIMTVVLAIIGLYYYFDPSKYFEFSTFEIILTSFPLIIYCSIFLSQERETLNKEYTHIISGIFIYLLCSTLVFINGNIKSELKVYLWAINAIIFILYQVLIFFNWHKHFRKKTLVIPTEKK